MPLPRPLIERFVRHLAEVRGELLGLQARMEAGAIDAEAREQVRALAHKLAGTAEGYGFAAVGEAARSLQEAAREGGVASSDLAARAELLSRALEQACRDFT